MFSVRCELNLWILFRRQSLRKSKFRCPCLQPLLLTILMSSLAHYSSGQVGEAWEPSNKTMLFLQVHSPHFSHDFSLSLTLLLYFLPVSLSLCLARFWRLNWKNERMIVEARKRSEFDHSRGYTTTENKRKINILMPLVQMTGESGFCFR
jgi:hypothetical protein